MDVSPDIGQDMPMTVVAFDILEIKQDLHFAVALEVNSAGDAESKIHQVHWASIKQPSVVMDDSGKVEGFSSQGQYL